MPRVSLRLGEILVSDGACALDDVRDALKNQVIFGGRLGTNLLELGALTEESLARALGRQHAMPCLYGELQLDPAATALLEPEIADRCEAIPYVLADRKLALLVVDPRNLAALDEVAFATGKQVHPIVVPEARAWVLLRSTYGIDRHLRGIDVDFGDLRQESETSSTRSPAAVPARSGGDLIGEREFDALYRGAAPPSEAATSPDDVIELGEIVEPEPSPRDLPERAATSPALPSIAAEVIAALAQGPSRPPPARLAPVPAREEPEPSPLGFDEALRSLEGVGERDAIARTVLRYARSRFARAILLTVHGGSAQGWAGLGEKLGRSAVGRIHFDLGTPGIVETVVRTRAHFLGPIPKTEANVRLLKLLGGGVPGNALVVPILTAGRVVNVFYADAGRGGLVDPTGVGELLILATRIANSYEALIARVG